MEYDHTDIGNIYRIKDPFVFTIFGASGDLAKLKIFPSIFSLAEQRRFPEKYTIIGYARSAKTDDEFRASFTKSVKDHYKNEWGTYQQSVLDSLLENVFYCEGQYDQTTDFSKYEALRNKQTPTYAQEIFYFSTPPKVFVPIIENLANLSGAEKMRLVMEKPFGADAKSAEALFHKINQHFTEQQIYLLDHYLGKKSVRSILPLRYNNELLNIALQSKQIANIQISALEPFGVEERLGYFDEMGTIKDMIQSHLLQILALAIMEIPMKKSAENIQREKNNVLETLEFVPEKNNVSLGQYEGYCEQNPDVCNFMTPTFAALKLQLDRENWYGTPIFLRSGKFLSEKQTYIVIELKKSPHQPKDSPGNKIIIELFPDESIHIRLLNEEGEVSAVEEISNSQSIACSGDYCLSEHGLLFLDVIREKRENFLSFLEIISCWRLVDQIVEFTKNQKPEKYPQKSTGPECQHHLMKGTSFRWNKLH